MPQDNASKIIGHEETGVTYRVCSLEEMSIELRKEIVDKIQHDDFEIDWKDGLYQ